MKLRSFEIVEYVKEKNHCSMNELMEQFDVSQATIHRDIAELVKKKYIKKVHGGVAIADVAENVPAAEPAVSHFSARINKNSGEKLSIAESASTYLQDGDIIFLDSSTTALFLARKIREMNFFNLTIITNSVLIIQEFHMFPPCFFLISVGGNFNRQLNSFLGKTAVENLKQLKITKAFFSGVGLKDNEVTTFNENHAEFLKEVLNLAEQKYLLIDSSKLEKAGIFSICTLSDTDTVISK